MAAERVGRNRRIVVACDLFIGLRLYRIPDAMRRRLKASFPGLRLVRVNPPGPAAVPAALREEAEIYWGNRFTREWALALPSLRWIHFGSAGVNRALIPEVRERRIRVTSSRGVMTGAVAATAMAFLCGLARGLHRCEGLRRRRSMDRRRFDRWFDEVRELEGETCLIAGLGNVGRRLARACSALGMRVIGVRNAARIVPACVEKVYPLKELGRAVPRAEHIVNLLPLTPATRGVFSRRVLERVKPGAFFVNVGRGETVDESALVRALRSGRLAGAGLDVFAVEPLPESSPLWGMPQVMLSPHVAGLSRGYWEREEALFTENLRRYLEGRLLRNVVRPGRGY